LTRRMAPATADETATGTGRGTGASTEPQNDRIDQIGQWKTEALTLGGDEQAAETLVRRIYEAGQTAGRRHEAETISALEQQLAKLRRSIVTTGS
jgi:hypothetical protein